VESRPLIIGARNYNGSISNSLNGGLIDEVAIYNRALTVKEIENSYQMGRQ